MATYKKIYKGIDAHEYLIQGVKKGAEVASRTIGPAGKNVMIDRGLLHPLITNDGFKSLQGINLESRIENMGLDILKEVVRKTGDSARGARTASTILTHALYQSGLKYVYENEETARLNVIELKKKIKEVGQDVIEKIKTMSQKVKSIDEIKSVATISSESEEIGEIVANVINEAGEHGIITTEEVPTRIGITYETVSGMKVDSGYSDSYMITNYEKMIAEYEDVAVLIYNNKLLVLDDLFDLINKIASKVTPNILIFAESIEGEALNAMILNKLRGTINMVAVRFPGGPSTNRDEIVRDVAALTGATILGAGVDPVTADLDVVGFSPKVTVNKMSTAIVGNPDAKVLENLTKRIDGMKAQKDSVSSGIDLKNLEDRIARISGGAAIIKVGTATGAESVYLKDKIDDAVAEAKAAYEEGIIEGGGVAFLKAASLINGADSSSIDGVAKLIVKEALEAPFMAITRNAHIDGDVFKKDILDIFEENPHVGYNAKTGIIVNNAMQEGVIDSVKVMRIALENAIEGATMLLTTDVVECEEEIIKPKN